VTPLLWLLIFPWTCSRRRVVRGVKQLKNLSHLPCSTLQIVFPKTDNLDALATQRACDFPIALAVAFDFLCPEQGVLPWRLETPWAAMPEASIDKNGYTPPGEIKIRFPRHV
jgi:hypothetical protein